MLSNRLAFAALAVACIAAAAGGGYLGTRQNVIPTVAQGASPAVTPPSTPADTARRTDAPLAEAADTAQPVRNPLDGATAARTAQPAPKRPGAAAPPAAEPSAPSRSVTTGAPAEPLPAQDRTVAVAGPVSVPQTAPPAALPPAPPAVVDTTIPAPRPEERAAQEPPRPPDPPQKTFEELIVRADSVIGLQAETSVSSERARLEDRVEARVTRDVRVQDMVAIPAGTRAVGSVVSVERGGKFKDRARLGIRFNTLVLADGTRLQISTDTIYRDGDSPGRESAAKVGGAAAAGAILGALFGGGKGAAIGAGAGAGAGSATVAASSRNPATLRAGEPITVRLLTPVPVTVEQK